MISREDNSGVMVLGGNPRGCFLVESSPGSLLEWAMQAGGVSISHGHYSENPTHLVLSLFSSLVLPRGKACLQDQRGKGSLVTGLYPWRITVRTCELVLSDWAVSLADHGGAGELSEE